MKRIILFFILLTPFFTLRAEEKKEGKVSIIEEARKKHPKELDFPIKKDGEVVGFKKLNESQIVPGLDEFLERLRKIVKNHDIEALKKLSAPKFYCAAIDGPLKQDFDHCAEYLELAKKESWNQILHVLNSGGCISFGSFLMPGLLECTSTDENLLQPVPPDHYIRDVEIKVYEKMDIGSKYKVLPANYLYKEVDAISSDETGCKKDVCPSWVLISSKSGLKGYVLSQPIGSEKNQYNYHIMIEHDGTGFRIGYLGFASYR